MWDVLLGCGCCIGNLICFAIELTPEYERMGAERAAMGKQPAQHDGGDKERGQRR